ncbi:MAG: glycoside hydrolase family 13 protein [Eubacteriales bacterium]|nr:glycoside hydrolase family 13 protein [Eubacteriales bacterium]
MEEIDLNWEKIELLNEIQYYVLGMRPAFRASALFSDETDNYVNPMEPEPGEEVTIRFRAKKDNIDAVYLCSGDEREEPVRMEFDYDEGYFDYFKTKVSIGTKPFSYYFEVRVGRLKCYYDKCGVTKEVRPEYRFRVVPGFSTPDWAKGAVMYQIMVDRFYNGDPSNDVVDREYYYIGDMVNRVTDWGKCPAYMGVREFYGGDIQGVMDKLDYLQELGVDVIYLNPIFVSPSNHKYDIQDYDYIDPHYGKIVADGGEPLADWDHENAHASKYIKRVTDKANLEASNQLFAEFTAEVHRRGMKVILDGVFNHCGSFNKWLDRERIYENQEGYEKGAYISADSPYRNFFSFSNEYAWPYNPYYEGWWGHDTLPKLAYEHSEKLHDYIINIGRKWVSPPFNVDGWRLDVAADLGFSNEYNHQFWRDFREAVKDANPNALILAEHYGDARSWLEGDQWDTVMNYDAFMEPLTWFFTGMEKHSDDFREDMLGNGLHFEWAMKHYSSSFLAPSLLVAMNELSNHDHSRFLTRTNHKVGRVAQLGYDAASADVNRAVMREAVVMQMTWPGAPTIYYGDEAGVCGFTDPDNRRTYPWGWEDHQMIDFHKRMIRIHKVCPELVRGSLKLVEVGWQFLCYGRFTEKLSTMVLFNNSYEEMNRTVRVHDIGITSKDRLVRIMETNRDGYTEEPQIYENKGGVLNITLAPLSAVILRVENTGA